MLARLARNEAPESLVEKLDPGRSRDVSLALPARLPREFCLKLMAGLVGESISSGDGKLPSSFCLFFLDKKDRKDLGSLALPGGSVPALLSPESNGDGRPPSWPYLLTVSAARLASIISAIFKLFLSIWLASGGTPDP
jgi:hypothetical protein